MPYSDFTLVSALHTFSLTAAPAQLFPDVAPVPVPDALASALEAGMALTLVTEKSRTEFIVAPVLLAVRQLANNRVALHSGQRLDADAANNLYGVTGFLFSASDPLPIVQSPILVVTEAQNRDIEAGMGQCAAEMLGLLRFNQRTNPSMTTVYGCVTTGETWQFLRLTGDKLTIDLARYFVNELDLILGVFGAIIEEFVPANPPAAPSTSQAVLVTPPPAAPAPKPAAPAPPSDPVQTPS